MLNNNVTYGKLHECMTFSNLYRYQVNAFNCTKVTSIIDSSACQWEEIETSVTASVDTNVVTFLEIYVGKISCLALCFESQYSLAGAQFTNNFSNLPAYQTVITQSLSSVYFTILLTETGPSIYHELCFKHVWEVHECRLDIQESHNNF